MRSPPTDRSRGTNDRREIGHICSADHRVRSPPVASGRYGNFPGMNEDPARLLYGDNYDRLAAVKAAYDPENLFGSNANVAPRTSDA